MTELTADLAASFARLTLGHVTREYPNVLTHMLRGPEDVRSPRELHPVFYGSLDWHSCVHGWWQLLTIARLYPDLPEAAEIRALADEMLVAEKMAGELAYLATASASFERPYGWAWALALHGEAVRHEAPWGKVLEPLARAFAERFRAHLPLLTYPLRVGTHFNTAFALALAVDWAAEHDPALAALIAERAQHWYGGDRHCQAWEPGGDEFLSGSLCEALLMARLLPADAFAGWLSEFFPALDRDEPLTLFHPVLVSDRSDPKIAHLDGLNLSRAWCWRTIARALGEGHALHTHLMVVAERHLAAAMPHLAEDYMGEHWLATFALVALLA